MSEFRQGKIKMLLKRFLSVFLFSTFAFNAFGNKNCKDLPGFKTLGKDSVEYLKCLSKKSKLKLKTESKLTDILKGEKKIKIPNPINGLKNIGKALKPSALEKK